jgi:hypothetical protein
VADEVQIKFGADVTSAVAALNTLKTAIAGATEPVLRLKSAFLEADAALQQRSGIAALAAFKAEMQQMVAARALSLQQALGFDIEYTARHSAEERARLEEVLAGDAATLADKAQSYRQLIELSQRYSTELARDQTRIADAARREADRVALPYRQAFDEIGTGWRVAVSGLIEGSESFGSAALQAVRAVERGILAMIETTVSKFAAGPLASLLGSPTPAAGEGVGDVLGNTLSRWIFGLPQQLGQAAVTTANTAALAANTAALTTLAGTFGATAATSGAGALGAAGAGAELGSAASSGGGLLGFLGSLFAFAQGGIVPSAARGWALPNFPGATPALLHAREMVLPAPISEGLQNMIAQGGGGGGDMHLHFHGPSDGPAVERWFSGLMARQPGVVRNMLRSNALTPRSL